MALRPALPALLLLFVSHAGASQALKDTPACPTLFADGRAPALTNPKLADRAVPLCFEAFAVLHSGVSRTPLYAAERLTRRSVSAARRVERADAFHDEDRLPEEDRASLADYVRSGYDRGHLAPAGDMPSAPAQAESFSLANIVPQNRALNRGLWAAIEESVRRLATERGEIFVVTGPIFEGRSVGAIKGRVLVPTQLFKAIYDPRTGEAGAYLAPNKAGAEWRAVSLAALRDTAGLDVFPALPEAAKARTMALPEPQEFSRQESFADFLKQLAADILRRLWRELMRAIF
ncbi:DNA/RNA non-specific endonuclease [Methylorubrum populi]|uniref:Endonuclease n=1 Tax=Methylorubrum rhodesianum TaxID=29427 RepID=A0ABU9ZAQ1_9HYPH|nr:DNA/RNA non-specific endonuclease [Methylorubrum rhodesianum]MBK3403272.1 DNA/RNA non-specific endonuclease [Methylorubrum rhodesianum]MBY0139630.1 DNA/RNA non-specific endonuclease [Methylorubrum populi]